MKTEIIKISAIGTRGKVKGQVFTAKPDSKGKFVLNKKVSNVTDGNTTNKAQNKVYVDTLSEAAELLESNEYLINLTTEGGVRALREYKKVCIEYL